MIFNESLVSSMLQFSHLYIEDTGRGSPLGHFYFFLYGYKNNGRGSHIQLPFHLQVTKDANIQ